MRRGLLAPTSFCSRAAQHGRPRTAQNGGQNTHACSTPSGTVQAVGVHFEHCYNTHTHVHTHVRVHMYTYKRAGTS